MPITTVKQNLVDAINNVITLLKQEYGNDYSYSITGNGMTLVRDRMNGGPMRPVPIVEPNSNTAATTQFMTTKDGNYLSFFYNPKNSLVVVDIVAADERGGHELLRQTLNEKKLLKHIK